LVCFTEGLPENRDYHSAAKTLVDIFKPILICQLFQKIKIILYAHRYKGRRVFWHNPKYPLKKICPKPEAPPGVTTTVQL
jgi:hypothetical protein